MPRPEESVKQPSRRDLLPTFGSVFSSYSERTGQSVRQLSRVLDTDQSPLSKIMSGEKEAPSTRRSKPFYDKLRYLPDVTPEELNALITAYDAPYWVATEVYGLNTQERMGPHINIYMAGVTLDIQFRSVEESWNEAVHELMHPDDVNDEMAILKAKLSIKLRSLLRGRETSLTSQ